MESDFLSGDKGRLGAVGSVMGGCGGQLAIEFMLIVIVIIMFIHAVIMPSANISAAAVEDTTHLAQARFAAERIANSIEYVAAASGDAKQTLHVFVPVDAKVICDGANSVVGLSVGMGEELAGYPPSACIVDCVMDSECPSGETCDAVAGVCDGTTNVCVKGIPVSAMFIGDFSLDGGMMYTVVVSKSAGVINVSGTAA